MQSTDFPMPSLPLTHIENNFYRRIVSVGKRALYALTYSKVDVESKAKRDFCLNKIDKCYHLDLCRAEMCPSEMQPFLEFILYLAVLFAAVHELNNFKKKVYISETQRF